jgi:arginine N-succinyltransferase
VSFRVRPARTDDFDAMFAMARATGGGFTNLPMDKHALEDKLRRSTDAFARPDEAPGGDAFVFMLENFETGEVLGTCQVFTRVGREHPFYSYRITRLTKTSPELGRSFDTEVLTLCTDFNNYSEVGGLFLYERARTGGLGKLLARSRYLFIRANRARFTDKVVSELRGWLDADGGSPFWDAIAGRFFGMSFQDADAFNAVHGTQFIADLMPTAPIYTAMLSERAREVMRQPHRTGEVAKKMLEREGFSGEGYVDIFDGGPTMSAQTDHIHSVREARPLTVSAIAESAGGEPMLLASGGLADFLSAYGNVVATADGEATIDAATAAALEVGAGATILAIGR